MSQAESSRALGVGCDPSYLAISQLGPLLAGRQLSPVELCRSLLARYECLEPQLNAFISLSPERILKDARAAEAELARGVVRGPLHGVPVAVKDSCWTKGERTTAGATVFTGFIPDRDATVVARLRAAGAIVFGKTNLPEFAYGPVDAYHYGPTRNPWDLKRYVGGSSMGSGAALAAGVVPGAIGSDTTGSIRNPSAWAGVVGLKPTYGLVPLRGVVPLALSLDHIGPMARSALDCALLLDVIAGYDRNDPTSADKDGSQYAAWLRSSIRGLRVGVLRDLWTSLPADMATAVEDALAVLAELGLELSDVTIAEWDAAVEAGDVLVRCEAAAQYRALLNEENVRLVPQTRRRLEAGLATPAPDYVDALRTAGRLRHELREIFKRVDLLALPARERTAPEIDAAGRRLAPDSGPRYAVPINIAGLPALTLPCGFDRNNLPIGLQIVGRPWGDGTLLTVGHRFQQTTDWHERRPQLPPWKAPSQSSRKE
ncbi:amidase [Micromonospora sp. NPDC047707]|uniref:amidase n=1 Tax=Micromonospora sp. NPDC047707 TaxID=3154498 RepID=UPI0034531C16